MENELLNKVGIVKIIHLTSGIERCRNEIKKHNTVS